MRPKDKGKKTLFRCTSHIYGFRCYLIGKRPLFLYRLDKERVDSYCTLNDFVGRRCYAIYQTGNSQTTQ